MSLTPKSPTGDKDRYAYLLRMLAKVRKMTSDPAWIYAREPRIHKLLRECVNTPQVHRSAIRTLDKLLPVLRGHHNFRRWHEIVTDAMVMTLDMPTPRLKAKMFVRFGELKLDEGNHRWAKQVIETAQVNAKESNDAETQLRCYILILKSQPQRAMQEMGDQIVHYALQLANRLHSLHRTRAALYQTLADIYSFKKQTRISNHYARAAYCIWRRHNDVQGKVACIIISANNARHEQRFQRVDTLLNGIEHLVNSSNTLLSHALLLYLRGCSALEQNKLEYANNSLTQAWSKFQQLSIDHMVANCHHSLALGYASMRECDAAREHLVKSRMLWRKTKSLYRLYELCVTQSYLARMSDDLVGAMVVLSRLSGKLQQIEDKDLRGILEDSIEWQAKHIIADWNNQLG